MEDILRVVETLSEKDNTSYGLSFSGTGVFSLCFGKEDQNTQYDRWVECYPNLKDKILKVRFKELEIME